MSKTIYASELGKCVAKKNNYRVYKDGGLYAIYTVVRELIWDKDYNCKVGKKLEAVHRGYIKDLDNLESAIYELDQETAYWMSQSI